MTSNTSSINTVTARLNGQEVGRLESAVLTTTYNSNDDSRQLSGSFSNWQSIGTLNLEPSNIQPTRRIDLLQLANYLEDYIRNRNQENVLFINHNTCQREIRYNSIDDIIELRTRLDEIIKEHYQI